jgi:CRP-like cAMP-binding protein
MKISKDELRPLFLFESLSEERLDWLAEHGAVEEYGAGEIVYAEGEPASCFIVLLEGEIGLYNAAGNAWRWSATPRPGCMAGRRRPTSGTGSSRSTGTR